MGIKKANGHTEAREELLAALPKPEISAQEANAAIEADKERRAKEYAHILTTEGKRLKCDLVASAEILGNQVNTVVRIIAR